MLGRWRELWVLLLCFSAVGVRGQVFSDDAFRQLAAKGLDYTYDCQFENSELVFLELRDAYPTHPAPLFLLATNRWWQTYLSSDQDHHAYIDSTVLQCLALNEAFLRDSPHQLEYAFFAYMGHALHARLATLRQEWMAAANRGRKALPFLSECLKYTEESPEFFFAAGIYHYYAETYPKDHFYVRPFMIFFPDGDASLGVSELEQAVAAPNFTRTEAMYYLSYIYLEPTARNPEKALQISAQLYQEHPQNPWFACEYGRVRVHLGRHEAALSTLDSLWQAYERVQAEGGRLGHNQVGAATIKLMMRVQHYRGMCFLYGRKAHEDAMAAFESSLALAEALGGMKGSDYLPANYFYLGKCCMGMADTTAARQAFGKVLRLDGNERYEKPARKALHSLK